MAEFYATRARGGVGLMVTGGMAPNREGGVFPGAPPVSSSPTISPITAIVTDRVHEAGGRIAMQILHAGRYAYGPDCVAPFGDQVADLALSAEGTGRGRDREADRRHRHRRRARARGRL